VESQPSITVTAAVSPPGELVELPELKDDAGQPVRVWCTRVRKHYITRTARRLPGGSPQMGESHSEELSPDEEDAAFDKFLALAITLITRGTYLRAPDGSEVRPAFWFEESGLRHPLSLPGDYLIEEDLLALVRAILRISGFTSGPVGVAAEEETFPPGDGAGPPAGGGVVAVLPGGGEDTVGSARG